jgi:hypothetical protein
MDQPARVERGKGGEYRQGQGQGLGRWKGAAFQALRGGLPSRSSIAM